MENSVPTLHFNLVRKFVDVYDNSTTQIAGDGCAPKYSSQQTLVEQSATAQTLSRITVSQEKVYLDRRMK